MERHGHLDLDPVIKAKLLEVSAATIDRMLANTHSQIDGQRKRRKGVGSAIRRSISARTFADWRNPPPGLFEIAMVEHCGGSKTDGVRPHADVDRYRQRLDRMRGHAYAQPDAGYRNV
jgi:hypothetical protein